MATESSQIFLGIDPGTAILGFGAIAVRGSDLEALEYGVITTPSSLPLSVRLLLLYDGLVEVIGRLHPVEVAVEQLYFARNVQSALAVGHARGVALLVAAQHDLPVSEFTPLQVKQAVAGYGRATKEQVQNMVQVILRLNHIPQPDDAADALAIALCRAQWSEAVAGRGTRL